jgi:hypothetical protein
MTLALFQRFTTAGVLDAATTLAQPGASVQGLTYVGGDQFIGIAGNTLYQYDRVADSWTELTSQLSHSFSNAGLAFDFGVLYAISSNSDQLYTIDLSSPSYTIAEVGSRGSSNGGGLSTPCKHARFVLLSCRVASIEIRSAR